MKQEGLFFPIPEKNLLRRFSSIFKDLSKGRSSTLLALPYTGRTSQLRFLVTQEKLLRKMGVDETLTICFIDIDKNIASLETYILEIIRVLERSTNIALKDKSAYVASNDAYLLSEYLLELIKEVSRLKKIILILTLNDKAKEFIAHVDNLIVQAQKHTSENKIVILWSIDTTLLRHYVLGHPSSTLLENIFYFPTFSAEESFHSIERIAGTKGIKISRKKLSTAMEITGGIAGFFHQFVSNDNFILSSTSQLILRVLKRELELTSENLIPHLAKNEASEFLETKDLAKTKYKKIIFKDSPTAHDIQITEILLGNLGNVVTRDEIAKTLWGKNWESKYSDWAIDKAISRLRRNIFSSEYKIITVKNLGYQLYKL